MEIIKKILPPGLIIYKVYLILVCIFLLILTFKSSDINPTATLTIVSVYSFGLFLLSILRHKIIVPKNFFRLLVLYLIFTALSLITTMYIYPGVLRVIQVINAIVIFITIYSIIDDLVKLEWIMNALIGILDIVSVASIYEYFKYPQATPSGIFSNYPFAWHTTLAAFLIFLIPIAATKFLYQKGSVPRLLITLSLILSFSALILAFSKGAFIALFLALAMLILISRKKALSHITGILVLIILTTITSKILISHTPSNVTKFVNPIVVTSEVNRYQILDIDKVGLDVLKNHLLLGSGPGTFYLAYEQYQDTPWLYTSYAHNEFVQNFSELGLLGGIIFILLIASIYTTAYKNKNVILKNTYSKALLVSLTSLLIFNLVDFSLQDYVVFFTFFIVLGLYFSSIRLNKDNIENAEFKKKDTIGLLIISFITLLASAYVLFASNLINQAITNGNNDKLDTAQKELQLSYKLVPFNTGTSILSSEIPSKDQLSYLNNALKYNKVDPEIYYRIADYYYQNKDYPNALKNAQLAVKYAPYANPQTYALAGYLYAQTKDQDKARNLYNDAIKKYFPLNSDYYRYKYIYDYNQESASLGSLYLEIGVIEHNNSYLDEAVKLNPSLQVVRSLIQFK